MSKQITGRKAANLVIDGPVKPGSVLHRALEMIAREVAKGLEAKSSVGKNHTEQHKRRTNDDKT